MAGWIRYSSVVVLCVSGALVGCKSGSGNVASRKDSMRSAQPQLPDPSHARADRAVPREIPALATPQNAEYIPDRPATSHSTASRVQNTCPIDGNSLGSSGTPVTVTLKGEPVFVCCQSCAKKAQKDPDRYLARVRAELMER